MIENDVYHPDPCSPALDRKAVSVPLSLYPFYPLVPKQREENLNYRTEIISWGAKSFKNAQVLWNYCSRDILYFVNTFGWTFDPRVEDHPALPFVTYPFQDRAFLIIENAIGKHDLVIEKCRDMGLSWIILLVFLWRSMFRQRQTFLVASTKEELVDGTEDLDALLPKIDFFLDCLPGYLKPSVNRSFGHIYFRDTRSCIDGRATTQNLARGGRRTALLPDEFTTMNQAMKIIASTAGVTRCRIFNGTPSGSSHPMYQMVISPMFKKLKLEWTEHPRKVEGLYTSDKGRLRLLDTSYVFPEDYKFHLDGEIRSPWYDTEESRLLYSKTSIAREIKCRWIEAGYTFFSPEVLDKLLLNVSEPLSMGRLEYDSLTLEPEIYLENPDRDPRTAPLSLWISLPATGNPPPDQYVVAADVSTGTGSSPSCLCLFSAITGTKIGEYVNAHCSPTQFARDAVAICRWLSSNRNLPLLIWEEPGPGIEFGREVQSWNYGRMYMRSRTSNLKNARTLVPGWHSSSESKLELLSEYRRALQEREFTNPSRSALQEAKEYILHAATGLPTHPGEDTDDPNTARVNHGDRVIADALAWLGAGTLGFGRQRIKKREMVLGMIVNTGPEDIGYTLHYRRGLRAAAKRRESWFERSRRL